MTGCVLTINRYFYGLNPNLDEILMEKKNKKPNTQRERHVKKTVLQPEQREVSGMTSKHFVTSRQMIQIVNDHQESQ